MSTNNNSILYIGNKPFCAFCGQPITPTENGQLNCQCEDAKQYRKALSIKLQLEVEAMKVMNNAPIPKYGLLTTIVPIKDLQAFEEDETIDIPSNPI